MSQKKCSRRFRQILISRIAKERKIPVIAIGISEITLFKNGRNEHGNIGQIEIIYTCKAFLYTTPILAVYSNNVIMSHAIYGFDALGNVQCLAD